MIALRSSLDAVVPFAVDPVAGVPSPAIVVIAQGLFVIYLNKSDQNVTVPKLARVTWVFMLLDRVDVKAVNNRWEGLNV